MMRREHKYSEENSLRRSDHEQTQRGNDNNSYEANKCKKKLVFSLIRIIQKTASKETLQGSMGNQNDVSAHTLAVRYAKPELYSILE